MPTNFIPEVYEGELLTELNANLFASQITNSNYTGEISQRGDTVHVYALDDLVANDKNADDSVQWQSPSGTDQQLVVDQAKDISIRLPRVQTFQADVNMQGAYRMKQVQAADEDIEDYVLSQVTEGASTVDATGVSSASQFVQKVREAKVALSDKDVPRADRFIVLQPAQVSMLSEYMTETLEDRDSAANGFVGRAEGFDIYESTRLPTFGTDDANARAMFGHTAAITLARQIVDFRFYEDLPNYHGGGLKGLIVYGAKVFLPNALGELQVDNA